MKSTFKLINLTRQGKVFGVRLQGRLKQTSKGRAKKRFEKERVTHTHTHTPHKATGAGNIATRRVEYPVPDVKPF